MNIAHLVYPRHTNNYKAKLLHSGSLILLATVIILVHSMLRVMSLPQVNILGYAANISPQKVAELTNLSRVEAGVGELSFSEELAEAAKLKGLDMLEKDYWSHVGPDGTEPWNFFKTVGYTYRFAGENLARDFSNPNDTIEAWLASPSHRENMLSGKYTEIGVAVVEGDLNGEDTTLIVQLFGTRSGVPPAVPTIAARITPSELGVAQAVEPEIAPPSEIVEPVVPVSQFDIMKVVTLGVIAVLVFVLAMDVADISRRGITRVGGRAFAHLSFMTMVLIVLLLVRAGEIV